MTTYPGDDPPTPDDPENAAAQRPEDDVPTQEAPDGTEPTQPVGYWERQANERAAEQARAQDGQPYPTTPYPQGGPMFNPTTTQSGQNPYAQGPYGQPTPAPYGGQPPGQPPTPGLSAPYMPMPPYGGPPAPDHPRATLSLVLGLVGVIGGFITCGVALVVSPIAWVLGHGALKEIRASQGRLGGGSNARTGMILGIIGTVFLVLAVIVIIGAIVLAAFSEPSTTTGSPV